MKKPPRSLPGGYQYDALDRLSSSNTTRRFYQDERIATEIEGTNTRRFVEFDAQPLAVQQGQATTLLATDLQTSVLQHLSAAGTQACAYTPYGHHPTENGITRLLAFNGEHPEAVTGHYLLGNGYRAYNPVLMRFNSPDNWSPFGEGGVNAYAYCTDPVMMQDPTGHIWQWAKPVLRAFKIIRTTKVTNAQTTSLYLKTLGSIDALGASMNLDTKPSSLSNNALVKQATTNFKRAEKITKQFKKLNVRAGYTPYSGDFINQPRRAAVKNMQQGYAGAAQARNQMNMNRNILNNASAQRNKAIKLLRDAQNNLEIVIENRNIRIAP